jgi:hypothetical protein
MNEEILKEIKYKAANQPLFLDPALSILKVCSRGIFSELLASQGKEIWHW